DDAAAPSVGHRVVLPPPAGELAAEAAARRIRISVVGDVVVVVAGELAVPRRLRTDLARDRVAAAADRRQRLLVVEEERLRRARRRHPPDRQRQRKPEPPRPHRPPRTLTHAPSPSRACAPWR